MDDPLIGNGKTVAQRFHTCTDETDVMWRQGMAECHGAEEQRQWRACFAAYARGVPTPWLVRPARQFRKMFPGT